MTEIFLKLSAQLNSSVFVLMALLVATGYALLKIGGWTERFSHLNQKIDGALTLEKTVIRRATYRTHLQQYPKSPIY